MDSTPVVAKTPDPIIRTADSSKSKEKARKEYVPEDPESEPNSLDSSSSKYDFSNDSKYKNERRDQKKKHQKRTKQDLSESSSSDFDPSKKSDYKAKDVINRRCTRKRNRNL